MQSFAVMVTVAAMVFATLVGGITVHTAQAASTYEIGSAQAPVDKDATSITINGKPYTTGMKVSYGDEVRMKLYWTFPDGKGGIKEGDQFTYDLPKGLNFKSGETYTIYGEDGGERGTFTVNGNRMVATFSRADTGSNIKAYVTVNGTITEESTGGNNGGNASFEFPGIGTLEVDVNEQHSLWAQKNGAISTDDPSIFDFVVEVHATGSNKNVKLEDTMGDLLTLQPGTLKLYTDANCTQEYTGTWQSTENADHKGFTANIDQMTDGQVLYARYSVKIDRQAVADAVKNGKTDLVKNKVKYYSDDSTNKKTTEQSIWLNNSWSVKKNGKANTVTKKDENGKDVQATVIDWTITVTAGQDGDVMPDATKIKDALGKNLKEPTDDVKVVYYDANWQSHETTLKWADLVSGKATLPDNNGKPYQRYEIKYSTEVEKLPESGSGDKITYKNDVTVTPGDGSGDLPGSGTVTIGKDAVDLSKKYTGEANEAKTLQWLTTFKAKDDLPAGKVLTDTVDDDGKDHTNDKNYVKPDWQVLDPDASKIKIYTDSKLTTEYDGSVTKTVAADRKSFTITFNDKIDKDTKLYISYTSTVLDGAPTGTTFYNTVEFVNKEATDSHKPVVDNMDKYGQSNKDDGNGTSLSRNAMRWQLKVHDIPADAQSVVITDTLSHGEKAPDNNWQIYGDHKYVPGSMVAKDSNGNTYSGVTVTDNGDHTLTFVIAKGSPAFKKAQSGSLLIEYETTFANFSDALANNRQYKNSAVISIDGEAQLPDNSDIWAQPGNLVAKKGVYDKNTAPYINYTVNVNPGGSTLNNGKSLTLTDQLGAALALRMDSVTITDKNTKAEVAGATYAYDPNTRTITFTVPDSRALTITYKAAVQLKPGQDFNNLGNNTIVLKGYANNSGTSSTTQTGKVIEAQGGITSSLYSLQIYKYADGDATKPLNGATFKVDKLTVDMDGNVDAWTPSKAESVSGALQSGTTGYTSTVTGLNADTIYRVTETQGPDGYQYDKNNPATLYVVFPGNSHDAAFYQSKTVNGKALTIATAGDNVTLQNYLWSVSNESAKKGSFKLDKQDEQGRWLNGATFTLTKNGDATFEQKQTTANNTAIEFTDLTPGSYTLTETAAPEGYQPVDPIAVTVTNSGAVIINGKTVSSEDGKHLTVTDRSNVTSIRARKKWDDGNNQDGKRQPARFQLRKSVDGGTTWTNVGQEKVINESTPDAQAVVEWTDLPVRESGKTVTYQVIEVNADKNGYTTTSADTTATETDGVTTTTFTNTYTPETVSVPVTKVWNDANDQDNLRPTEVIVQLYANGVAVPGKTLTITPDADGNWKGEFTDLPKYENGALITYTVQEVNPPSGYTVSTSGSVTGTGDITITNTHYPTDTKIRVSKRDLGGAEIAGAKMEIDGTEDESGDKVTKQWTSKAGESYVVELKPGSYTLTELQAPNGYYVADPISFKVVRNSDNSLSVTINDKTVDGNLIVMTDIYKPVNVTISKVSLTDGVGEIAGATLTVTGTTLAGETINPIQWVSTGKPRNITLVPGTYNLHESQAPSGYQPARDIAFTVNLDGTVTVNSDTAKNNIITMTDELNTTNVTVSKTAVTGVAELAGAEFKLTGTTFEGDEAPFDNKGFNVPADVTISTDGKALTWASSADGPKTFQLPNGTYELTETKAPEGYDVASKPVTFTVENGKVVVGDVVSGGNLVRVEDATKSYTAVSVTKRWEDGGDTELRKGVTVTAVLYKNGEKMTGDQYRVELNATNNWSHDWTGLDAKDSKGDEITYTVNEELTGDNKDEYHASIVKSSTANGYDVVIYNIHQPDSRNIDLTKTWNDADNQDGKRPEAIQVTVTGTSKHPKDDGTLEDYSETMIVTTLKPNDKGEWKWTLENLPKKNAYGYEYTYSVKETPVADYNDFDDSGVCTFSSPTGTQCNVTFTETPADADHPNEQFAITNKHTPETVSLTVNKVWDDAQNFNGQRPKNVTVWLLTSLWDAGNGWPEPQSYKCKGSKAENVSCVVLSESSKATTSDSDSTGSDTTAADTAQSDTAQSDTVESASDTDAQADSTDDTWTYTFKDLPKYRNGKLLRYSVTEEAVDDYTASLTDDTTYPNADGQTGSGDAAADQTGTTRTTTDVNAYRFTLSNRNVPNKTDLTVRKAWDDNDDAYRKRPTSIWVQLYEKTLASTTTAFTEAAGTNPDTGTTGQSLQNLSGLTAVGRPVELNAGNNWAYTFKELSKDKTYEVREMSCTDADGSQPCTAVESLPGYQTPIITGDQTTGYTITNTIVPILPDTGGEGVTRYLMLGFAMIALSGAFFARRFAKKGGTR
ncbi:Cna B-type domain-containing protein [Bifidobacterium amazonense]|uniref:Cna B-type domain-containing protein n=1 Tax=Bifidobacterium amazonense TaxID=2809027 RepID=A0ABS9VTC4_9BIFI|nr:Cna B-type domain-containing protein [Bifidobacterium amazonense]MCH9275348.1 Cna B-type domain-containing protein [Bifidobacterium amazonense]